MSLVADKHLRRNIIDLKENYPLEFGKFIVALRNLELSDDWPRICGIHGNTFKPNDAGVRCPTDPEIVEKIGNTPDEPFYCAHSETRFVAWHTPYVYQYELLLNKYNTSDDKGYIALPYLWLRDMDTDYSFINESTITITFNGEEKTMDNPLAAQNVKYYSEKGEEKTVVRNGFLRPKTDSDIRKVKTTNKELNNVLYAKSYPIFSSNNLTVEPSKELVDFNPLEIPHNNIHDFLGGEGGNMSEVSISAYDPLFWMHHCNIDRYFYNWMYNMTDKFSTLLSPPQIPLSTQRLSLAPFSLTPDVYNSNYEVYAYGWMNNTLEFIELQDVLNFKNYPYSYEKIEIEPYQPVNTSVEVFGMPIPMESTHIEAIVHPKNVVITDENRDEYVAGSATWFGINRYEKCCKRCNKSRTNLKIDIGEYMEEKNITKDELKKYKWFIEGKGRLHQHGENDFKYKTYNQEELIKDGSVNLFTYGPCETSNISSAFYWRAMKGVGNMLGLRKKN